MNKLESKLDLEGNKLIVKKKKKANYVLIYEQIYFVTVQTTEARC